MSVDVEIVGGSGSAGGDPPAPAVDQAADIADALINMIRVHSSIKSRVAVTADSELAPLFVLVRLVKDGPRRAKELSDQMCADQSTVSRQVAALVKGGLVERQADPGDGRASILVPTRLGIERVLEHFAHRGHVIGPVIADWPDTDRAAFLRLIRQYTTDLESRRDEVVAAMTDTVLHRGATITDTVPHRGAAITDPVLHLGAGTTVSDPFSPRPRIERSN